MPPEMEAAITHELWADCGEDCYNCEDKCLCECCDEFYLDCPNEQ